MVYQAGTQGAAPDILERALVQQCQQHDCKVVEGQPAEEGLPLGSQDITPPEEQECNGEICCMDDIILQGTQRHHSHQHHISVMPAMGMHDLSGNLQWVHASIKDCDQLPSQGSTPVEHKSHPVNPAPTCHGLILHRSPDTGLL